MGYAALESCTNQKFNIEKTKSLKKKKDRTAYKYSQYVNNFESGSSQHTGKFGGD